MQLIERLLLGVCLGACAGTAAERESLAKVDPRWEWLEVEYVEGPRHPRGPDESPAHFPPGERLTADKCAAELGGSHHEPEGGSEPIVVRGTAIPGAAHTLFRLSAEGREFQVLVSPLERGQRELQSVAPSCARLILELGWLK